MTTAEKIQQRKEKIQKSKEKIVAEQAKIIKLNKEIEELESLEVKGLLKELNLPLSDIRDFIKGISSKRDSAEVQTPELKYSEGNE